MIENENKDLIQSFIVTTAKYDYNTFEKRIMYKIIEYSQKFIEGAKLDKNCNAFDLIKEDEIKISFELKSVMQGYNEYRELKKALKSLASKGIEFLSNVGAKDEVWRYDQLILCPNIEYGKGLVSFKVSRNVWKPILDFSKGWRKYELNKAMSFSSTYSMRLYELISRQVDDKVYSITQLKEWFNLYTYQYDVNGVRKRVDEKYKLTADFIRRVIEPAQIELNNKGDYTFSFMPIKEGRKITKIKFTPIKQEQYRDEELEIKELNKKISIGWDLEHTTIHYLCNVYGFTTEEIKNNINLFKQAEKCIPNFHYWLTIKRNFALSDNVLNPKGYIINAIKGELKNI